MIAKVSLIDSPLRTLECISSFLCFSRKYESVNFRQAVSLFTKFPYLLLTSSGTASFVVLLSALKRKAQEKEVVLPAYTAGSLVVGVRKAGLKVVLCDISLNDFNIDCDLLKNVITSETLAVVAAHMFGIGIEGLTRLREWLPEHICVIEDCAQAMGSMLKGKPVGSFGDAGFFSFNRGKNLPAYGGGACFTQSQAFSLSLQNAYESLIEKSSIGRIVLTPLLFLVFSFVVNPFFYGLLFPLISYFKDTAPPIDIALEEITGFQSQIGNFVIQKMNYVAIKRYENGMFLLRALKEKNSYLVPKFSESSFPAFNRFPLVVKELRKKECIEKELWKKGIETSKMYGKPLHQMFNLGIKKDAFPNSVFFAEHLLTLPVHPSVRQRHLETMVEVLSRYDTY